MAGDTARGRLCANLTLGSVLRCHGRTLARTPARVLEESALKSCGFRMRAKSLLALRIEAASDSFAKNPGGSGAAIALEEMSSAIAQMGRQEGEEVFRALERVVSSACEPINASRGAAASVANWLLGLYSSAINGTRSELAADIKTLLVVHAATMNREMKRILILADSGHFSADFREMQAFTLARFSRQELEEISRSARNGHVRCAAGVLLYEDDERAEEARVQSLKGPYSFSDLTRSAPESMEECLRMISRLDSASIAEEELNRDLEKLKAIAYGKANPDEAPALLTRIEDAIGKKGAPASAAQSAAAGIAEAMSAAQEPLKCMLALAFARIYSAIPERSARIEIASLMEGAFEDNKEALARLLRQPDDELEKKTLLILLEPYIGEDESALIRQEWKIRDMTRLVSAFAESAGEQHAGSYLLSVQDIATRDQGGEVLRSALELLLESEKRVAAGHEGAAAAMLADCILRIVLSLDAKRKEDACADILRLMPAIAPATRDAVLGKAMDSDGEVAAAAFGIVSPAEEELRNLAANAVCEVVRKSAEKELAVIESRREKPAEIPVIAPPPAIPEAHIIVAPGAIAEGRESAGTGESDGSTIESALLRLADGRKIGEGGSAAPGIESIISTPGYLYGDDGTRVAHPLPESLPELLLPLERYLAAPAGPHADENLAGIATASASLSPAEMPLLHIAIGRLIESVRSAKNEQMRDAISARVAACVVAIAESAPAHSRDRVAADIRFRLALHRGTVRKKALAMLRQDQHPGQGALVFSLVQPVGAELRELRKSANSGEIRALASGKLAEMSDSEILESLGEREKAVMQYIVSHAEGECPPDGAALIRLMRKLEPGLRHMLEQRLVSEAFLGAIGAGSGMLGNGAPNTGNGTPGTGHRETARGWKSRVPAVQAAIRGVNSMLSLQSATREQKIAAVMSNPGLLTGYQMRMASVLAGKKWAEGDIADPVTIRQAMERVGTHEPSKLRGLAFQINACTRLARVLAAQRAGEDARSLINRRDVEIMSDVSGGRIRSAEDMLVLAEGLREKNTECFAMLSGEGGVFDFGLDMFRQIAISAWQVYSLLDMLGATTITEKSEDNSCEWAAAKGSGAMEDRGFSYVLSHADGTRTRISAVFDGMSGHRDPGRASAIAKEVFELGLVSGMLETQKDAALLCELADLAIAGENHAELRAGRLGDMLDGMGSTIALVIEESGRAVGIHAGDSKWMVMRKAAKIAGSNDHTLMHEDIRKAMEAIEAKDYEKGNRILAEIAGRSSIIEIHNQISKRNPSPAEIYEHIMWHFQPGEGSLGKRTSALGVSFPKLGIGEVRLEEGDSVVLCTDGISNVVCEHGLGAATLGNSGLEAAREIGRFSEERRTERNGGFADCGCRIRSSDEDRLVMVFRHSEKDFPPRKVGEVAVGKGDEKTL